MNRSEYENRYIPEEEPEFESLAEALASVLPEPEESATSYRLRRLAARATFRKQKMRRTRE